MPEGIPGPINILVADDDKAFNREVEFKLVNAGFFVKSVANGQEALDALAEKKYDLLVLDLVMPVMSGFEALREIRAKDKTMPIVVLSLLQQEEDFHKAKNLGATEFLVKESPKFMDDLVAYANQLSMARSGGAGA